MQSSELRQKFIKFFEERGHKVIPSASLVPENDPSVLFNTAGMQQFKRFYTKPEEAPASKIVTCQKCIRTGDIEEVGDDTHLTFFEMLGNFSFGYPEKEGSYFKEDAIKFAWEFLTEELKIEKKRIHATYFEGKEDISADEESLKILQGIEGLKEVKPQGFDDNFWSLGTEGSPGGPTVEFYVDGIEVWNLVFNEFVMEGGKYLPAKYTGVDTGMGFERLLTVINDKKSVYETDLFEIIIKKIEELSKKEYETSARAFRIIADHLKASIFLSADGVSPSNTGQGYIMRRLIRRAVRYGWQIDIKSSFLPILKEIINIYEQSYQSLRAGQYVTDRVTKEEEQFQQTIQTGLKQADYILQNKKPIPAEYYSKIMQLDEKKQVIHKIHEEEPSDEINPEFKAEGIMITNKAVHEANISGKEAFDLFQSFGFPIEMILDLAQEKRLFVTVSEFKEELKKHQELSRTASAGMFKGGLADSGEEAVKYHTATHLLQQALRDVLSESVGQKGSNINAERMRFDFTYAEKLTPEQIEKVENIVNEKIKSDLPVTMKEMSPEEAKESGAIGLFEHKYGDKVKVYSIDNFSREICGGPHVTHTGELGHFKILKEESSSAGVRRIKAILE